jgi:predicted transcriptional regulator
VRCAAQLPDGASFFLLCPQGASPVTRWGEPPPVHAVVIGCNVAEASALVHADGVDLARNAVGIGLSCRLCERQNCPSGAFPPLEHRLALNPMMTGDRPYRFKP